MLDLLPVHLQQCAFSKPKLAPTARSRIVGLARIAVVRCTPLEEFESRLDRVTNLICSKAIRDFELLFLRSE